MKDLSVCVRATLPVNPAPAITEPAPVTKLAPVITEPAPVTNPAPASASVAAAAPAPAPELASSAPTSPVETADMKREVSSAAAENGIDGRVSEMSTVASISLWDRINQGFAHCLGG